MMDNKDIEIYKVKIYPYSSDNRHLIEIRWSANIGFGLYSIEMVDGEPWVADSETMDRNDPNRSFLKMLLMKWAESVEVVE